MTGLVWVTAFLDVPEERSADAARFWQDVTGWPLSPRRGESDEFATFLPPDGDPVLKLQATGEGDCGLHLDLHVPDVGRGVADAEALGAARTDDRDGYVVMSSPGGFGFCVVGTAAGGGLPVARSWPGGRSAVEQVCLDIPPSHYDTETGFWTALTGWPRDRGEPDEFENLPRPAWSPYRILLQRLEDEAGATTAHLDLASDDRAAEVRRHEALGARTTYDGRGWTTLEDPAGVTYCVTDRVPGYDLPG